jgi:signal transduction histidine kinase
MEGSQRYYLVTQDADAARRLQGVLCCDAQCENLLWREDLANVGLDLQGAVFDAAFIDAELLRDFTAPQARHLSSLMPETPLLVLASSGDLPAALDAVRLGAEDYLLKSTFDDGSLLARIDFMIARFREQRATRRCLLETQRLTARFEGLMRDNADAILVLDAMGKVVFANPAAGKLYRNSPLSLIGSSVGVPVEDGGPFEIVIGHHEGADTVADVRVMRTTWDDQPAFLATLRDISLRKRTERDLVVAKQQAELANEMKSKFLANMSHELRTPLNSILGFTEMMERGLFGPIGNERYSDYLATIRQSGTHLLTLINNLLDLSKIEAGREELHEEDLDVAALLEAAAHAEEPTAKERGLTLICQTRNAPEGLRGDRVKLDQIILNLLSNAIKFTPEGGRVTLAARQTETGACEIRVSDTGCGMDETEIPRAMSAFAQIRAPYLRARDRGTGLGLPIARSLVALHGGQLSVSSRRGVGTEVIVLLPVERVIGAKVKPLSAAS